MAAVAGKKSAPAQVHHLAKTISAHCFNWDRSQLAFCPNNGEVHIYADCHKPSSKEWCVPDDKGADGDGKSGYDPKLGVAGKPYYNLKKHSLVVTGIDWHPTTNKIVTCSQDRNAFVWDYNTEENVWEPAAVVLRFPRAAVQVRWSPDGRKFAVAGAVSSSSSSFFFFSSGLRSASTCVLCRSASARANPKPVRFSAPFLTQTLPSGPHRVRRRGGRQDAGQPCGVPLRKKQQVVDRQADQEEGQEHCDVRRVAPVRTDSRRRHDRLHVPRLWRFREEG